MRTNIVLEIGIQIVRDDSRNPGDVLHVSKTYYVEQARRQKYRLSIISGVVGICRLDVIFGY